MKKTANSGTRRWSGEVTRRSNALDLEANVFKLSDPHRIALSLKHSAETSSRRKSNPYHSAMDSMERLEQALAAVATFQPMSPQQVRALQEKTSQAAMAGEFEPFKTSQKYDSTAQHPAFLD